MVWYGMVWYGMVRGIAMDGVKHKHCPVILGNFGVGSVVIFGLLAYSFDKRKK